MRSGGDLDIQLDVHCELDTPALMIITHAHVNNSIGASLLNMLSDCRSLWKEKGQSKQTVLILGASPFTREEGAGTQTQLCWSAHGPYRELHCLIVSLAWPDSTLRHAKLPRLSI